MTRWIAAELDAVGAAEELQIAPVAWNATSPSRT